MKKMKIVSPGKALHIANKVGGVISGALIMAMMIIMVGDVVLRRLNSAFPFAIEFVSMLLVFVVFLAMAESEEVGAHVRVNVVVSRLPQKAADILYIFASLAGLAFFGLMGWRTMYLSLIAMRIGEYLPTATWLLVWPVKLVVSLGCLWIGLQFLSNIIVSIRKLAAGEAQPS